MNTTEFRLNRLNRRKFLSQLALIAGGVAVTTLLQACGKTAPAATTAPVATTASEATPVPAATSAPEATAAPSATTALATTSAPAATTAPATGDPTAKVVAAAEAFLATLDATQKGKAIFTFTDAAQRIRWSNFPTGIFQRAGLRMGDLSQAQRDSVMALVAATLSPRGYQHAVDQIEADEVLKGTDGGGNLIFGKDEYYVSILGTPSATTPWMLQFGGHHLALNATVVGQNITLAPSLTGGQPAEYTLNGKTVRTIGDEVDAAFKLINALDAAQRKKAIVGTNYIDLVTGPGKDGVVPQPEGILASELNADQQTLLFSLIDDRVGLLNDADAALKIAEVKAGLAKTYFAWSGPTAAGSAVYYRVQGPTLIIEYSPQQMGGAPTNHIHAMYRDPVNDYGAAWTK